MHQRSNFVLLTTFSGQFIHWWSLRSPPRTTTNGIHWHRHSAVGRHNSWLFAGRSRLKYPLIKAAVKRVIIDVDEREDWGRMKRKTAKDQGLNKAIFSCFHMALSRARNEWFFMQARDIPSCIATVWSSADMKNSRGSHAIVTQMVAQIVTRKVSHFSARKIVFTYFHRERFTRKVNLQFPV